MDEINDLKLDYERKTRVLDNLKKNYQRRKKLGLIEPAYEQQIKFDIKESEKELAIIQRQIRSIESQRSRSKFMN